MADIPTKEEIAKLPLWAQVAFAARCARRALPVFEVWEGATPQQIESLKWQVENAESTIPNTSYPDRRSALAVALNGEDDLSDAYGAVKNAAHDAPKAYVYATAATAAAAAYTAAAYAAAKAADSTTPNAAMAVINTTYEAAYAAAKAATAKAVRADFDRLTSAARRESWTDDTPVPPEFFGPMWPDGEPEGWPTVEESVAIQGSATVGASGTIISEISRGIDKLPYRAQAALAGRCARRVLPLALQSGRDESEIRQGASLAEQVGAGNLEAIMHKGGATDVDPPTNPPICKVLLL